jgi:hypothetical protein
MAHHNNHGPWENQSITIAEANAHSPTATHLKAARNPAHFRPDSYLA